MNWQEPSTPIKLMFAWHSVAILLGIVLSLAVDARAAGAWFGAGIIGAPLITVGALVWSRRIRKRIVLPRPSAVSARAAHGVPARAEAQSSITPRRPEQATALEPVEPSRGRAFTLLGADGYPWMEVQGEFARMSAIHMVIGRAPRLDEEIELPALSAELRPEPTNPYDPNAVMVIINGWHVGYMPKEEALRYHVPLARLVAAGIAPVAKARLWATTRRDYSGAGTKAHARITLALGAPDRFVPLNNPPEVSYSLLPWGPGLQVTGEENHLAELSSFVTPDGDGIAIGTIHRLEILSTKGPVKEVVEVRLDGDRIGQMTPASSAHFFPTIKHLEDEGRTAAVWVRVKGSPVAAQAVLQAAKAHELPHDWFSSPNTIPVLYPARTSVAVENERAEDVTEIIRDHAKDRPTPVWGD